MIRVSSNQSSVVSDQWLDDHPHEECGVIGIFAPKGVPEPIVQKLNAALNKYLTSPEGTERIKTASWEPYPLSPEEVRDVWFKEAEIWGKVIKDAGIKAQ